MGSHPRRVWLKTLRQMTFVRPCLLGGVKGPKYSQRENTVLRQLWHRVEVDPVPKGIQCSMYITPMHPNTVLLPQVVAYIYQVITKNVYSACHFSITPPPDFCRSVSYKFTYWVAHMFTCLLGKENCCHGLPIAGPGQSTSFPLRSKPCFRGHNSSNSYRGGNKQAA